MEIPEKLIEYLDAREAGVPPTNPDEPLGLDSLGLIRLVQFMEAELGIHIEDYELVAKNFTNLLALGALLENKHPDIRPKNVGQPASSPPAPILHRPARRLLASCRRLGPGP